MPQGSDYDGEPMRQYLALRFGESKLSEREAGEQVAREQGAESETEIKRYAEGIRRRCRVLRKRGKLPEHDMAAIRSSRMLDAAVQWYADRDAERKKRADRLAILEGEAAERGLDAGPDADLLDLQRSLQRRIDGLQIIAESGTETGLGVLLAKKPASPEALHLDYLQAVEDLAATRRALKIVEEIRECRYYLGVTDFPHGGEDEQG